MSTVLFVLFCLVLPPGAGNVPQNTGRWLTLQKGEFVTIPCFYHPWYKNYVKQWCSGLEIFSCTIMASTDSPQVHRVSIIDDPTQGVFTVTMNNVQESDSDTPDMSVKDNMVEAQLGDSVTVHCFYSHSYRDREKKWCSNCSTNKPNEFN
ncbi:CMRF35-like molecule 1 [Scleropages formosus]|uniref:CMRF35-like molecule 1 n=1 Tax=Scleropages formosus TaxID=113540 RepID=UPI0010FAB7B3|nr:CMRF35-like molecule 1 [Scleropages formosus]